MFTRLPIPQHRLGEDRISRWYAYDEIYIRELVGTAVPIHVCTQTPRCSDQPSGKNRPTAGRSRAVSKSSMGSASCSKSKPLM
ncbi:hypothetical protein ACFTXM_33205, partial [Streptomyces sp. NPDC056930]|uniref:hypothetical protein n=1 Tax=Streptomyces sp. NPDC056930 TaxID=3345967 RepID=UPI003631616D